MKMKDKDEMLKRLDSDTYESLVYIGYYLPKSQKELKDLVYKSPANIQPLINARKRLYEMKWVFTLPGFSGFRNIPLKSSPTPFIEYIRKLSWERKSTKGDEFRLTKDDLNYIEMLIDSNFFRETFFSKDFFETCYGIHRSRIRDVNGRLKVSSAFEIMKYNLFAIAIQSICLWDDSFKVRDMYLKNIQEVMAKYKNFNNFLDHHFAEIKKNNLKDFLLKNPRMEDVLQHLKESSQDRYYLENVVFNGLFLCLPMKLALKIIAVSTPSPLLSFVVSYYGTINLGIRWGSPELSDIPGI